MDLSLATLKVVSFYSLHNVSTLNQCRKFSCVTVVCKHFASYQCYPNYKWDLTLWRRNFLLNFSTFCI
jgi:surface polysaccharide O-acyltransferase-like enzyme